MTSNENQLPSQYGFRTIRVAPRSYKAAQPANLSDEGKAPMRRTTEEMLVLGSDVLIGQTVLESLDLHVDCMNQRVSGNPAHPDQPIIKIKMILAGRELQRGEAHL